MAVNRWDFSSSSSHQIEHSPRLVTNGSNMYISSTHAKSREAWEKPGLHRFAVFFSPGPAVLPVTSRDLSLETADPRESQTVNETRRGKEHCTSSSLKLTSKLFLLARPKKGMKRLSEKNRGFYSSWRQMFGIVKKCFKTLANLKLMHGWCFRLWIESSGYEF